MNGVVAREYFYRELSWSHNKVPYAFILIRGYTSGGFLESPGNVSGLTPNITCFYLLTSCIIFKAIKNSILNANKIACQGSVITATSRNGPVSNCNSTQYILGYNLGQNKMEQQIAISPSPSPCPHPTKSRMKPREGQKRTIFPILIFWGDGGGLGFPLIFSKIVGRITHLRVIRYKNVRHLESRKLSSCVSLSQVHGRYITIIVYELPTCF